MKKFAGLAMAAVAFISTLDSAEAQILQRFRSNLRDAISSPAYPQPQPQPYTAPRPDVRFQPRVTNQPRYVQPQVRIEPSAPQRSAAPQRLTPYSQLRPEQRVSVPQRQLVREPVLSAPAPITNPAAQPTGGTTVRVVTYYDPRSGRTFQRRYLIPSNSPTSVTRATEGQVATRRRSIFTQSAPQNNPVATNPPRVSTSAARTSLVPPIQFSPRSVPAPVNPSPGQLPALAGPALAAPISRSTAQPIAASIDASVESSQVGTASAELDITSTGIPDLSGITVDPAPAATGSVDSAPFNSEEEASQELFFDNGSDAEMREVSSDEIDEELNYSVLEEFEEE